MSYSALYIIKENKDLTPYKYLDSLDSVRFRDFALAKINGAQLHAYADFFPFPADGRRDCCSK